MFSRHKGAGTQETRRTVAFDDFHEWVLSLPWVVERPYGLGTPGVRSFGIDCEPLGRRQLWLLTARDSASRTSVAVILPNEEALALQKAGRVRTLAPMPGRHTLVSMDGGTSHRRDQVEALVLKAYRHAMS